MGGIEIKIIYIGIVWLGDFVMVERIKGKGWDELKV